MVSTTNSIPVYKEGSPGSIHLVITGKSHCKVVGMVVAEAAKTKARWQNHHQKPVNPAVDLFSFYKKYSWRQPEHNSSRPRDLVVYRAVAAYGETKMRRLSSPLVHHVDDNVQLREFRGHDGSRNGSICIWIYVLSGLTRMHCRRSGKGINCRSLSWWQHILSFWTLVRIINFGFR